MLTKLTIKNIALIDSAEISFSEGLNVLSGETGAGKSVILESINFALGAKADKTLIRNGAEECYVCAEFDVSNNSEIQKVFIDQDIERDDTLIISRRFNVSSKNTIKINGNSATVGMLRKFTALLVDVHGQSEHFELLSVSNQLKLLDRFGGSEIEDVKEKLNDEYAEYREVVKEIDALGGDESQRLMRLDILNYQILEIENCNLQENEEEELKEIRDKLRYQEKIISSLNLVKSSIEDEGGVSDILGNANRSISQISALSKEYAEISERVNGLYAEADDIASSIDDLIDSFDFSSVNPDEIESRLEVIKKIKKKYGDSYGEIYEFLQNAKTEKDKLERFNELGQELLVKKEKLQTLLYKGYLSLSEIRKKYGRVFSENVLAELRELGMNKASFEVHFSQLVSMEECQYNTANGIDNVEFMFSANLGEPIKPLSQVISGGEMSRFMLSIKAQSAKFNDISTFVFDEIDAGISGTVARVVAEKLCRISQNVQVIAISHLPQITSFADNNLFIYKNEDNGLTHTNVKKLNDDDKIKEIARLVGGSENDVSATELAKSLIESANKYKNTLKI